MYLHLIVNMNNHLFRVMKSTLPRKVKFSQTCFSKFIDVLLTRGINVCLYFHGFLSNKMIILLLSVFDCFTHKFRVISRMLILIGNVGFHGLPSLLSPLLVNCELQVDKFVIVKEKKR